ncbi:MAG: hypothetical protein LBS40_05810 [Burkholderiales bacterium]|jgi:hypothetical protein|nr:hypothetical protein [Burkholderiales bacterium]
MKTIHIIATAFTLFAAASFAHGSITESENRFTGTTLITAYFQEDDICEKNPCTSFGYTHNEKTAFLSIYYHKINAGERYLKCHDVNWLADGERIKTPDANLVSSDKMKYGRVSEAIKQSHVEKATIEKIANAKKAEFQICLDEFELTPDEQAELREFLKRVEKAETERAKTNARARPL